MSDYIPIEIITGILLRLPVFSLVRFRCVSKQWRSIIDSPSFTKLQIQHSNSTNKNATLIFLEAKAELLCRRFPDGLRRQTLIDFRGTFNADLPATVNEMTLFGSCNGLLCLGYETDQAMIHNVAINKSHCTTLLLPDNFQSIDRFILTGTWVYETGYGFGYDSGSDDYKVVRVFHTTDTDHNFHESEVIHFGVRSNSCKIVNIPYVLYQKMGAFVGGAIHWVAGRYDNLANPKAIVGFHLGVAECKEIPQPEYSEGGGLCLRVGELGECLCIFDSCNDKSFDVWMMKEYGVKESWIKLFSVPCPGLWYEGGMKPRGLLSLLHGDGIRALGFSMTGGEVLLQVDGKGLVWYDMKKGCVEEVTIRGLCNEFIDAIVCFESLVPPNGKPRSAELKIARKQQQQQQKKKRDDFLSTGFKLKL
ncbi:F-box protein CPR1 [Linum grandiflorum]